MNGFELPGDAGMLVVELQNDLCASVPREWHRFSVEHILPSPAEVIASDDLLRALP